MKIGQTTAGTPEPASVSAPTGRSPADETAKPGAAVGDSAKVELSPVASTLLSGVKGAPAVFDAAKVERISQAIADGSFTVDAEAIADKLIANAQEVLGSVKR